MSRTALFSTLFVAFVACVCVSATQLRSQSPAVASIAMTESTEPWNNRNDPVRLQLEGLRYNWEEIVKEKWNSGRSLKMTWPSYYWPTWLDGPNYRWSKKSNGERELSPLEKYDLAFTKWGEGWSTKQWKEFMLLKPFNPKECNANYFKSKDAQYYEKLGAAAGWWSKNRGNWKSHDGRDSSKNGVIDSCDDQDGIQKWTGLCHAWAPASILELEPLAPVEYNGVTFQVSDIKALLQIVYDRVDSFSVGSRCNLKHKDLDLDSFGRIAKRQCRDTNAGGLHVALVNMLARERRPFVIDRTRDYEVWNQPVIGFDTYVEETFVSPEKACKWLGFKSCDTKSPFTQHATKFVAVKTLVDWVTESDPSAKPKTRVIGFYVRQEEYKYVLELDADGDIIGGEYHQDSTAPDFIWLPTGLRKGYKANPHMDHDDVMKLLTLSRPDKETVFNYWNSTRVDIPDHGPGITTTLHVDKNLLLNSVRLHVDIKHATRGDLEVFLTHKSMKVNVAVPSTDNKDNIRSIYGIDTFNGGMAGGDWRLHVNDKSRGGGAGVLKYWGLELKGSLDKEATASEEEGSGVKIPNGLWNGHFRQGGNQYVMMVDLKFVDGKIIGAGKDAVGPYQIKGSYEPDSSMSWVKSYNVHDVKYVASYNAVKREIKGTWTLSSGSNGVFALSPQMFE